MSTIPNFRHQIKVVFFDIDETLLVKHKDFIPETVLPALKALKANGIIPAIATGRSICSIAPKVQQLIKEVGIELLVTMNGQFVSYGQNVIEKHPIPTAKIARITDYFDSQNIAYAFVSQDEICVSAITPELRVALDPITKNYRVNKDYYQQHEVFQILPFYREDKDEQVVQSGILDGLKVVRWDVESVDLFDSQGSKARGIQAAVNYLGLTMDNVMAFGDGLNDLEMMEAVGVGVAMGNAHDDLKSKANFVTDHIEEHGIANFLRKAGLID